MTNTYHHGSVFFFVVYTHILVAIDYVTKWVEAIPTSSADHNTSIKMLKEVIFRGLESLNT